MCNGQNKHLVGQQGLGYKKSYNAKSSFVCETLYSKMSHAFLLVGMFDFTLTKLSKDGDIFGATATV